MLVTSDSAQNFFRRMGSIKICLHRITGGLEQELRLDLLSLEGQSGSGRLSTLDDQYSGAVPNSPADGPDCWGISHL